MKNILYIGNKLSQKGKTVTTIETLSAALQTEGFKVVSVSKQTNKVIRLLDMLFSILKNFRKTDYVLIDTYSTQNFYYAYFCSQLCRMLSLEYIPILHGGNLPNRLKSSPKLSASIFNNSHVNIAPSNYTKSNFETLGYSNINIIPNAININNYLYKQRSFDTINLLWVRSFSRIYNPKLAIDILHELKNKGINATLCMVGPNNDGSLEETKNYAKDLNVEVKFTGKLSKNEWIELSTNYNVFINTTNFDNMPVSIIEAMALGLPVVSTNVGGMPFLIDDKKTGILVNPDDKNAFVAEIIKLTENPKQTQLMTQNARNEAEKFHWYAVRSLWISTLK